MAFSFEEGRDEAGCFISPTPLSVSTILFPQVLSGILHRSAGNLPAQDCFEPPLIAPVLRPQVCKPGKRYLHFPLPGGYFLPQGPMLSSLIHNSYRRLLHSGLKSTVGSDISTEDTGYQARPAVLAACN